MDNNIPINRHQGWVALIPQSLGVKQNLDRVLVLGSRHWSTGTGTGTGRRTRRL